MGVEPKIVVGGKTHPNHPFVHRVWNHEIFTIHFGVPVFLETPICRIMLNMYV